MGYLRNSPSTPHHPLKAIWSAVHGFVAAERKRIIEALRFPCPELSERASFGSLLEPLVARPGPVYLPSQLVFRERSHLIPLRGLCELWVGLGRKAQGTWNLGGNLGDPGYDRQMLQSCPMGLAHEIVLKERKILFMCHRLSSLPLTFLLVSWGSDSKLPWGSAESPTLREPRY